MAYGLTRSTVMAIVPEVTEGTAVLPSGATQFIPILPDISFVPETELQDNEEIKNSIGISKSIQGVESGNAEISLYLKHSGVEGTAPNYGELLEAVFGSTSTNSTQRTTTSGSTTTVIALGAGGTDFARGKAVLIKDSTNGYSIRPVHSVSSNNLTLGFAVATAPATGMNVGKCINYAPAASGHQSLTLALYRGNDTAFELIAGAKALSYTLSGEAGGLITQSFSLSGSKYYFNPINIAATDIKLDFLDNATTRVATITAQLYRDPQTLADALETAMNALGSANTFTVEYNDQGASAGKFTITSTGTTLSLLWSSGANTANTIGDKIGFVTASDDTGALTYTSDNVQSWASAITPTYDSADPLVAKYNDVLIGSAADTVGFCAESIEMSFEHEEGEIRCISAETGLDAKFFQKRTVNISVTGKLDKHDADKFYRYLNNSETRFMWAFGNKSGGNWVAGQCGCLYIPSCTVTSFEPGDGDGIVNVSLELQAFVDSSGNGEVYLNFL